MPNQSSFEEVIHPIPGLVADGDLSSDQHLLVKLSGDLKVALAGNNECAIGVLMNKPNDGQAAVVAGPGSTVKLKIGAGVTAGAQLCPKSDGSGEAVTATTGDYTSIVALQGGDDHDTIAAHVVGGLTVHA